MNLPVRKTPLIMPLALPLAPRRLPWEGAVGGSKLWEIDLLGATTRFYLHAALAAPSGVAPNPDAAWTDIDEAVRRRMTTSHTIDAMANGTQIDWTSGALALDRQYISAKIRGGTINGTCKCQLRSTEGASSDEAFPRLGLRIVSADGTVVRGTLLAVAHYGNSLEIPAGAGLTNRSYALTASTTFTEVVAEDGDRLVVEIGYTDVAGTTPAVHSEWGSTAASDLPEDDTNATQLRPWFEVTIS